MGDLRIPYQMVVNECQVVAFYDIEFEGENLLSIWTKVASKT